MNAQDDEYFKFCNIAGCIGLQQVFTSTRGWQVSVAEGKPSSLSSMKAEKAIEKAKIHVAA